MNFPKTPAVVNFDRTLATLKRGDRAVIDAIDDADPMVQRLMTLGLVEGVVVERGHSAIGGDPTEFRVHGLSISLRREQARCFSVTDA
ncbi:MAG: FeoA family protein [Pseudomonadota bacterium]